MKIIKIKTSVFINALAFKNKIIAKEARPMKNLAYKIMKSAKDLVSRKFNGSPSKPGEPPKERSGTLKKSIKYKFFDTFTRVWVGILKVSKSFYPHWQEFGVTYKTKRNKIVTIEPRPYMEPTLAKHKKDIPRGFKGFLNK